MRTSPALALPATADVPPLAHTKAERAAQLIDRGARKGDGPASQRAASNVPLGQRPASQQPARLAAGRLRIRMGAGWGRPKPGPIAEIGLRHSSCRDAASPCLAPDDRGASKAARQASQRQPTSAQVSALSEAHGRKLPGAATRFWRGRQRGAASCETTPERPAVPSRHTPPPSSEPVDTNPGGRPSMLARRPAAMDRRPPGEARPRRRTRRSASFGEEDEEEGGVVLGGPRRHCEAFRGRPSKSPPTDRWAGRGAGRRR